MCVDSESRRLLTKVLSGKLGTGGLWSVPRSCEKWKVKSEILWSRILSRLMQRGFSLDEKPDAFIKPFQGQLKHGEQIAYHEN